MPGYGGEEAGKVYNATIGLCFRWKLQADIGELLFLIESFGRQTSQSSISGSSSGSSRKYKSSVGYLSNLCLDNSHYLVQHPLGSSYLIK